MTKKISARDYLLLVGMALAVVGIGSVIGMFNMPDEWYFQLNKPSFNPPNWVFAPVWTTLYVLIAMAGWRTWRKEGLGPTMALWLVQMGLNYMWSPVFFGMHNLVGALVIIGFMLVAIMGFISMTWERDRIAALLFVPYAVWVCFAGVLNAALVQLNY